MKFQICRKESLVQKGEEKTFQLQEKLRSYEHEILIGKLLGFFDSENHLIGIQTAHHKNTGSPPETGEKTSTDKLMKWQRWFRTLLWTILEYGRFWSPKNHSPNAFSPSWVSSYRQNAPGASQSTLTNFKFWSPNFHLQKCLETAGETLKLQWFNKINKNIRIKSPDSGNRLLVWVVSLYLCVLMLPWSKKTIHSAQYIAQYCYSAQHCSCSFDISTIFQDILHDWQLSFYSTYTSATQHFATVHLQLCVRNHFVEKLDHSFVAISSGPTCWHPSISICSFQGLMNHLLEKLEQSKK